MENNEKKARMYYVSGYTEYTAQNDHFRPICVTKIGVATERHIYNDSEIFDVPNGDFYVDVYPDLQSAWDVCKSRASLATIVVDDNVSDEDRRYIADDINNHPEMMDYHFSGSGTSCYTRRMAYMHHHEMESMCRANRIDADFKLAGSTSLSEKYSDSLIRNDSDSKCREDIFEKQAEYQRTMGLRFPTDVIRSVVDTAISDEEAEQRMDAYYEKIADIYGMDYVSISDISIESVSDLGDGFELLSVMYDGNAYDVKIDFLKRASRERKAADAVLQRVREALNSQYGVGAGVSVDVDKEGATQSDDFDVSQQDVVSNVPGGRETFDIDIGGVSFDDGIGL